MHDPIASTLDLSFTGTTAKGLTSPLNLSELPIVELNENQALELLENISRDPEGKKLAQFISVQIAAGRRLVVTEDIELSKFVKIVPEGWEYAGNFSVHDGHAAEIRNIKVGGNFQVNGNPHIREISGLEVDGDISVENSNTGPNLEAKAGSFYARKAVLGNVSVQARGSVCVYGLTCMGDFTASSKTDRINVYNLRAKKIDLTSANDIWFQTVTADEIHAHAEGKIFKSVACEITADKVMLEAGREVDFQTCEPHQSASADREININEITVVAGGRVNVSHSSIKRANIASGGNVNISRTPSLQTLHVEAVGKTSAWRSAVREISGVSEGGWVLTDTPNLDMAAPPPRRGLTTATLGQLFTVDQLAAAVNAQATLAGSDTPAQITDRSSEQF